MGLAGKVFRGNLLRFICFLSVAFTMVVVWCRGENELKRGLSLKRVLRFLETFSVVN